MFIIVEGNNDKDFIELCCYWSLNNYEIAITNGKCSSKKHKDNGIQRVATKIEIALEKGERVLIIFDADDNREQSLKNIHKQLDSMNSTWKSKCEIFLVPNNQDSGNLETLLEHIAKEQCILKCFDSYIECITKLQNQNSKIKLPAKKSKVFAYLSSFGFKNGDKNFQLNESMLDLQHHYLKELKNFLVKGAKNVKIKNKKLIKVIK